MTLLFIGGLGTMEIILILAIVMLLFGGKKIPELMRGLGRGVREFKDAMNQDPAAEEKKPDDKKEDDKQ